MTLSKYKSLGGVFMFIKQKSFKYIFGIFLFMSVFMIGFVKMNIVYSSTGLFSEIQNNKIEFAQSENPFSKIKDNSFLKIYKEDYGYDVVLKIFDNEKTFSLKLPWINQEK